MSKIAFIFPGQASQYSGMGREIHDSHPEAAAVFRRADEVLGFPLSAMCFQGSEDELKLTENTQPAILTVSVAVLQVLRQRGLVPDFVAGHSLGEYSALVAAGSVVTKDVPARTIVVGSPAKVLRPVPEEQLIENQIFFDK